MALKKKKPLKMGKSSASHSLAQGLAAHQAGDLILARSLFQKVLRENPKNLEALCHLGTIHAMHGDLALAEKLFTRAVTAHPSAASALINLGTVYRQMGRAEDAVTLFDQAITIEPERVEAWLNLAYALAASHRTTEAIASFHQAITKAPDNPLAHYGLAATCFHAKYLDDALAAAKRAVDLSPNDYASLTLLGEIHERLGNISPALHAYSQVTQLRPDDPSANIAMARCYEKQGELLESRQRLLAILKSHPDNEQAVAALGGMVVHQEIDKEELDRIIGLHENLLVKPTTKGRSEISFLLGRLHEKKGDYPTSFAHYRRANELQKRYFDLTSHRRLITAITKTYAAERQRTLPRCSEGGGNLVFIVGMPRSGSTLVEQIISSHPESRALGEYHGVPDFARNLDRYFVGGTFPDSADSLPVRILQDMASHYLSRVPIKNEPSPSRIMTDKMLFNYLYAGLIGQVFPDAKMIHVRRSPMDTCLSCYFHHFYGRLDFCYDLATLGGYYRLYDELMRHWRRAPPLSFMEIRYENLVADQENESRKIIDFCGLSWNDACLSFHQSNRFARTKSYQQVRQPIYTTSVARHQRYADFLGPLKEALGHLVP